MVFGAFLIVGGKREYSKQEVDLHRPYDRCYEFPVHNRFRSCLM